MLNVSKFSSIFIINFMKDHNIHLRGLLFIVVLSLSLMQLSIAKNIQKCRDLDDPIVQHPMI